MIKYYGQLISWQEIHSYKYKAFFKYGLQIFFSFTCPATTNFPKAATEVC